MQEELTLSRALVLGAVQGFTEFLPISSSGHLVLFQRWLGLRGPELAFDILLHLATLAAIVGVFRRPLVRLLRGAVAWTCGRRDGEALGQARLVGLLAAGTLPAALGGFFFQEAIEGAFSSPRLVGLFLLVTGGFLFLTRRRSGGRAEEALGWRDALLIGLAQAAAILPGISRSGATICAGLALGLRPELSARFSFFLAIPAILGAGALRAGELLGGNPAAAGVSLAGALVAGAVGYGALRLLLRMLRGARLGAFAYYCWAVGLLALLGPA